jgi:Zn-dependent protease with chaperone function
MRYIILMLLSLKCFAITHIEAQQVLDKLLKVAKCSQTKLKIRKNESINAEYGGFDKITINEGALKLNINEVAFILSHEVAHKMLNHRYSDFKNELEADAYGASLLGAAGFNRCQGVKILLSFKGGETHPSGVIRYNKVKCK